MPRRSQKFIALALAATLCALGAVLHPTSSTAGPTRPTEQRKASGVQGLWYTQDRDGVIEFFPCADKICGRFHWLEKEYDEEGRPSLDDKNPNPALRSNPLCGMTFMGGFTPETETRYSNGWIYSPRNGSTYQARLTLADPDTLLLHGYIFTPFLGETQTWKRAENPPICASSSNM